MIRLLISFLFVFITVFEIIAQQDPQFSQYMFNQMAVNPGYAGSNDAICITAVHRQQWVGVEGAPVTPVVTVNAPFKLFGASHGIGLSVMSDQIGFNTDISAGLAYAFRLPLGQGNLGIGVNGVFLNKALTVKEWKTPGGIDWTSDPSIPGTNESIIGFDMGFGVFYRAERVYLGLATTHLLEPDLQYDKDRSHFQLKRHYHASAGCTLPLNNPAWEMAPSLMVYSDGTASQITANMNFMYNKKVWVGAGYRLNDAIIAMVGVDLFNGLKIGYAFDYTYTSLSQYFSAGGSHEVMVGYCFNVIREKVVKKYKSVRFL